jgi:hypothetical protein
MISCPLPKQNHRVGIHYFPDHTHYRQNDLKKWLPILLSLNISWITIYSSQNCAIPEFFLEALSTNGIEPIIQFQGISPQFSVHPDIELLLNSYARWGIHYISFFEQPNQKSSWTPSEWAQENLVDRFLDSFINLAKYCMNLDLCPIFPPFQPGGDYWDLVFLQSALRSLVKRKETDLLDKLIYSAYAFAPLHQPNWGQGGPSRWTGARPYYTPPDQQDHLGVYIYEWYSAIIKGELGETRPILLLRTGSLLESKNRSISKKTSTVNHTQNNLELFQKFYQSPNHAEVLFAPEVLSACFWLLSTSPGDPSEDQGWFKSDHDYLPVVDAIRGWLASRQDVQGKMATEYPSEPRNFPASENPIPEETHQKVIQHYLLLPMYSWGIADWDLDSVRPFILQEHPAVGFSFDEARLARKVTVFEPKPGYCESLMDQLNQFGCKVQLLKVDGTVIAQ